MASFLTEKTMPLLYEALSFIIGHVLSLPLALNDINIHGIWIMLSLWALVCTVWPVLLWLKLVDFEKVK
jgi:hypothetical protein